MTKEERFYQRVGRIIMEKRAKTGWTQAAVAQKLEVGTEAVSRMERGQVAPSLYRLQQLANLFKCGVDEFLIESSVRVADQEERIARKLKSLSVADREMVVEIVERLSARLAQDKPVTRKPPKGKPQGSRKPTSKSPKTSEDDFLIP